MQIAARLISSGGLAHGKVNEIEKTRAPANVHVEDLATNEDSPISIGWGTQKVAGKWIGEAYDQFVRDAPADRPSKK